MKDSFTLALNELPHGAEFRFVDNLLELVEGKRAVAVYRLRGDEFFLAGHFPGQPMMPAVLMVEALAQVAGMAAQTDPAGPKLSDLRLTAIRSIKIYGTAVPGDLLIIESEVMGRMGGLLQAGGRVLIGEKVVAEGQVTLSGKLAGG